MNKTRMRIPIVGVKMGIFGVKMSLNLKNAGFVKSSRIYWAQCLKAFALFDKALADGIRYMIYRKY